MKRILIAALLVLFVYPAVAQPKKRGKVKRKYRDVERMSETLPQVVYRGMVRDASRVPVAGASVEIEGINRQVHSNEKGLFMLSDLPAGRLRLKASGTGYLTKTVDFMMQAGYNDHYITLEKDRFYSGPLVSVLQKREQQPSDIPASITGISGNRAEKLNITSFSKLAGFLPSLYYENNGSGNAGFSGGASSGFAGFPSFSPQVAITVNQVPVSLQGGFPSRFFDMQQLEVVSGSQNVLLGRNASGGAVALVTRKPDNNPGGYVTAGGSTFAGKEAIAAVNLPLVKNKLAIRLAGAYSDRDGYVKNYAGTGLNGENLAAGRFSLRFTPVYNHMVDIVLGYSRSATPGAAYISPWASTSAPAEALPDVQPHASKEPVSKLSGADATLTWRYFRDEHNYWTLMSSVSETRTLNRLDADGSPLPALELEDAASIRYFFQEVRYNFVKKSRTNGSFGVNYLDERSSFSGAANFSDRLIYDILTMPGNFLIPGDGPFPVHPGKFYSVLPDGISLPQFNHESSSGERTLQSGQAFLHLTYQFRNRLYLTAGARAIYDRLSLVHEAGNTAGGSSAFGVFTGAAPNLVYAPAAIQSRTKNNLSFTGQAGLMYRQNENFQMYINAVHGKRPGFLMPTGESIIRHIKAETINSLEAGWKASISRRVFWEVSGFYRMHHRMHTLQHSGSSGHLLVSADGKGVAWGAETSLKAHLVKGIQIFGQYAWMQSEFDSLTVDKKPFQYAANSFSHAPGHAFTAGLTAETEITRGLRIFASPWYSWKSHFWFTEANTSGLEQPAYGTLNASIGIESINPALTLSVYGTNLLDEQYHIGGGHQGGRFGMPTIMPGPPRMLGARITWKF